MSRCQVSPARQLRNDDLVTSDRPPKRHRKPGNPVVTLGTPGRGTVIYVCALLASGASAIRFAVTHDEAWWWLKALASLGIFALLVILGAWFARSMLSLNWQRLGRE